MKRELMRRRRGDEASLDKLFSDFLEGSGWPFTGLAVEGPLSGFQPRIDISETKKEIQITAELPGLDEKEVAVELDDDVLTIRGEKKEERTEEDKEKHWYRREMSYGSFCRTILLPGKVDEAKVKAKFKKGVLSVKLPKQTPDHGGRKTINIEPA